MKTVEISILLKSEVENNTNRPLNMTCHDDLWIDFMIPLLQKELIAEDSLVSRVEIKRRYNYNSIEILSK